MSICIEYRIKTRKAKAQYIAILSVCKYLFIIYSTILCGVFQSSEEKFSHNYVIHDISTAIYKKQTLYCINIIYSVSAQIPFKTKALSKMAGLKYSFCYASYPIRFLFSAKVIVDFQ